MDRPSGTDEDADTPGRRLERYIKARWPRAKGGMRGLAGEIQSSTETMYAWFRGEQEPSMAHLRAIADQLGVRRAVLVAVLDGDPLPGETDRQIDLEPRVRALEAAVVLLAGQGDGAPQAQSVPRETVG